MIDARQSFPVLLFHRKKLGGETGQTGQKGGEDQACG